MQERLWRPAASKGVSFVPSPGTEKTQLKELTSQGERTVLFLLFPFFKFIYRVVHPSPSGGDERLGDRHLFLTQSRGLEEFSREAKRAGAVLKPGIWGGLAKASPSC